MTIIYINDTQEESALFRLQQLVASKGLLLFDLNGRKNFSMPIETLKNSLAQTIVLLWGPVCPLRFFGPRQRPAARQDQPHLR